MDALVIATLVLLPFGWVIYKLIRYSALTVGDDGPLKQVVQYAYGEDDFFKWMQTPLLGFIALLFTWACYLLLSNLDMATKLWHYGLTIFSVLLWLVLIYLLVLLFQLERKLWGIIRNTVVTLDPHTKSISVGRAGDDIELTASNTALIECHWLNQGKLGHYFYRFIDHSGQSTTFYDYGKGLPFAIEAYFKGIPYRLVEHRYPFRAIPFN